MKTLSIIIGLSTLICFQPLVWYYIFLSFRTPQTSETLGEVCILVCILFMIGLITLTSYFAGQRKEELDKLFKK